VASHAHAQALTACKRILPPLVRILIGLGISAPEFSSICKQVYVNAAADRLTKSAKRVNRSRIAIVTGLTRAEVTRVLKSRSLGTPTQQWQLHRASRVLNGWFTDPEFLSRDGRPRSIPLKGGRGSFQVLVKRYSGDMPPRAMMDELVEMSAVQKQKNGRIKAITRTPRGSLMSPGGIASLGTNARAFMDTLCHNLEDPSNPIFVASVAGPVTDSRTADVLLERIRTYGKDFLSRIDDQLRHPPGGSKARRIGRAERLGVTVVAHREPTKARRIKRA